MKVLMISRKFGPLSNMSYGPYAMIYKLIKGLSEKIDISVLSSHVGLPVKENIDGINVYRAFSPAVDDLIKFIFLPHVLFEQGIVKKTSPDIIHSQDIEGGVIFKKYKNEKAQKIFAIKTAVSYRTKDRNPEFGWRQKIYNKTLAFWERLAIQNADFFITHSLFLRNEMVTNYNLDESRFFRIFNGTYTDVFKPGTDVSDLRKKLNLENKKVLFSTCTGWRKGFDALLLAFNEIKKNNEDVKLLVAGTSDFGVFEKFIDKKIVDASKDIILLGHVSNSEMPAYYNLADLFLFPSYLETQPNALIEAVSCGTPSVIFDSGGSPEIVSENEGAIVELGDTKKFADATQDLLDKPAKIRKLNKNCRERALRDFTIERAVSEHIMMYEKILE